MRTVTRDEYVAALKSQGEPIERACLVCPACGSVQCAQDLIDAGAGKTFDEIQGYLGFSCVGRFTHGLPPPAEKGTQYGCNWTLGGLFQIHELEVIDDEGVHHVRFEVATPEQAKEHLAKRTTAAPVANVGSCEP